MLPHEKWSANRGCDRNLRNRHDLASVVPGVDLGFCVGAWFGGNRDGWRTGSFCGLSNTVEKVVLPDVYFAAVGACPVGGHWLRGKRAFAAPKRLWPRMRAFVAPKRLWPRMRVLAVPRRHVIESLCDEMPLQILRLINWQ